MKATAIGTGQNLAVRDEWTSGKAYLISARPPSVRQRWLARAIVACLFTAFVVTVTFRSVLLARQDAFVPIANTIEFLNDLITASLLYALFAETRQRGLLALAGGYLFTSLILIPHQLTFPGAFATNGLLDANLQTTAWLYIFHHLGFLIAAILYTIARNRSEMAFRKDGGAFRPIASNAGGVMAAVVVLTWFVIAEPGLLPTLMRDSVHPVSPFDPVISPLQIASCLFTIIVFRRPRASILDLWLQVAVASWVLEVLLQSIVPARFSLVFYVARTMGVLCSSFVLLALLTEAMMLSTRLVLSVAARDQERDGKRVTMDLVIGSIAHELRQPLTAIKLNGHVGIHMLSSAQAEPDEVRAIFDDIGANARRASEIVDSVRSFFAPSTTTDHQSIDANDLVGRAVEMVRVDAEAHGVAVHFDLAPGLPAIHGHRGQLTQVLVNGLTNALDSLARVEGPRRLEICTVQHTGGGVSILVEDSGAGIDPPMRDHVFEPFYTTRASGMGLGLSICRSIVEAHGGALSLLGRPVHGAVFRVDFPPQSVAHPLRMEASRSRAAPRSDATPQAVTQPETDGSGP